MKIGMLLVIIIGVAILALLCGAVAGFFIARSQLWGANVPARVFMFSRGAYDDGPGGMMNWWRNRVNPGYMGRGMMGTWNWDIGQPRMKYMLDAYAEALDISTDQLQKELKAGKSLWNLASAKGIKAENFEQFLIDTGKKALAKMVADGEITQKQADAMLERMQQNRKNVNPEDYPCFDGLGGRPRIWRWRNP